MSQVESAPNIATGEVAMSPATAAAGDRRNALEFAADEPIPPMRIDFTSVGSQGLKAAAVPSIDFDVGIGDPLVPTPIALAHGTTDASGRATIELSRSTFPAGFMRGKREFWVRVTSAGYQQRTTIATFPEKELAVTMPIVALRGCTLRGRVFDTDGQPTTADLRIGTRESVVKSGLWPEARASDEGWFEIHAREAGTFQLFVDGGDRGTSVMRDVVVPADSKRDLVELHLRGSGVVRGHVRDARGEPSAGLELHVVCAALDDVSRDLEPSEPLATDLAMEGNGRTAVIVYTDKSGAFDVRGLRGDRFSVFTRVKVAGGVFPGRVEPLRLTRAPVASDGVPLDLVFERTHIAVHVENEDHTPWSGQCRERRTLKSSDWPFSQAPIVVVQQVADEARIGRWDAIDLCGKRVKEGEFTFEVPAQHHYLVGLLGRGQAWDPVDVFVPANGGRVDVALVAHASGVGTVQLSAFDMEGQSITGQLVVKIEDPRRGVELAYDRDSRFAWPMNIELPEGEYRIAVEGAPLRDPIEGMLYKARAHGRFEANVHVSTARVTELRADLPQGARVHLKLDGVEKPEDLAALEALLPGANGLEYNANLALITLYSDGHWPALVDFRDADAQLHNELLLGTESTSEIVSAGRFRIEARMPGGRSASANVVLVDGQTTDVTLRID